MVFKRFKGGTFPFLKAVVGPGSACRGCPQLFAGLNVRSGGSRGPTLSGPTEGVLLMTYFGNQKHGPLNTPDKMASDGARPPGA